MSSEWLKVMLEEISRKKAEAEQARAEPRSRIDEQPRPDEHTRIDEHTRKDEPSNDEKKPHRD